MVRLLIVTPKYPPLPGGASHVFSLIAENLIRRGNNVRVLSSSFKGSNVFANVCNGVRVKRAFPYHEKRWKKLLYSPAAFMKIFSYFLMNSRKFDVVETHTVGEICLFSQMMAKLFRKKLVKHVIDMHTSPRLLRWPKADRYVNCGSVITKRMIDNGIDAERIQEINLPIVQIENEDYRHDRKKRIFLFVGEVSERKGVRDLLYVMKYIKSKDMELHIVGTGPLEKEVIAASKLDGRIKYHGHMPHKGVIEMMRRTDVLVHPTYDDVMPLTILEAMGWGNAIITRDIGEIKKSVDGAGFFVFSKEGLLQAMQFVIDKDPVDKKKKALHRFVAYTYDDVYELNEKAVTF